MPKLTAALSFLLADLVFSSASAAVKFESFVPYALQREAEQGTVNDLFSRSDLLVVDAVLYNFSTGNVRITPPGTDWSSALSVTVFRDGVKLLPAEIRIVPIQRIVTSPQYSLGGRTVPVSGFREVEGRVVPSVAYDRAADERSAVDRLPEVLTPLQSVRTKLAITAADGSPVPPGEYLVAIVWTDPASGERFEIRHAVVCTDGVSEDDRAGSILVAANRARFDGDLDRAVMELEAGLRLVPASLRLRYALMLNYRRADRPDDALRTARELLVLSREAQKHSRNGEADEFRPGRIAEIVSELQQYAKGPSLHP